MPKMGPRLFSALRRRFRPKQMIEVLDSGALLEAAHWTERAVLRMFLPPSMLRMQGAFAYGPDHPFVRALTEGENALVNFYTATQPTDISYFYRIDAQGRVGHDLPPWELPWYLRRTRTPPPGELSLGPEHGVSFYGPVSTEKIALEYRRLTTLRDTLARHGYDPDGHGDIEGYILRDGDSACFFVRGGKHRAAVLTALGHDKIPVCFRSNFPRVVDTAQVRFWPLVRAAQMDPSLASDILRVYVSGRTRTRGHAK